MIDRILMELYDDFSLTNKPTSLIKFAKKTFSNKKTEQLFIGCCLILFSNATCFKPRYDCTREKLESIILLAKEKAGSSNLLAFYVERINTTKGISKYLNKIINDPQIDSYANFILKYLNQFKPDMIAFVKNHKNLEEYISSKK